LAVSRSRPSVPHGAILFYECAYQPPEFRLWTLSADSLFGFDIFLLLHRRPSYVNMVEIQIEYWLKSNFVFYRRSRGQGRVRGSEVSHGGPKKVENHWPRPNAVVSYFT